MNKYNYIIVITPSNKFYGMFKTPNSAAVWATKNFNEFTDWHIAPVIKS